MQNGRKFFTIIFAITALAISSAAASAPQPPDGGQDQGYGQSQNQGQNQGQGSGRGQRARGGGADFGGFPGGGRGILGTVTEATADHYTVKTETGDSYVVHFSVNTRILKQPAGGGQRGAGAGNAGQGGQASDGDGAPRQMPQPIKSSDIKVGDVITAGGELDAVNKSVGAVVIMEVDPARVKQMQEMKASYGKTWLAGRITNIDGTTINIEGAIDHAQHAIAVDENTSFKKHRDAITLADIQPGDQLRAEGAVRNGVFLATTVTAMAPPDPNQVPGQGQGGGRGQGHGNAATDQP